MHEFGRAKRWYFFLTLSFSLTSFFYKNGSRISFNFFGLGDEMFSSDFMKKWGWFQRHVVRLHKNLGSRWKSQKTETRFCKWKSNGYSDINILLSMKNRCTLRKERPENAFLKPTLNCCKTIQEKIAIQNNSKLDF